MHSLVISPQCAVARPRPCGRCWGRGWRPGTLEGKSPEAPAHRTRLQGASETLLLERKRDSQEGRWPWQPDKGAEEKGGDRNPETEERLPLRCPTPGRVAPALRTSPDGQKRAL